MNLHEYQAKKLFAEYGIPVPAGRLLEAPASAAAVAGELDRAFPGDHLDSHLLDDTSDNTGGFVIKNRRQDAPQLLDQGNPDTPSHQADT